MFKLGIIFGGPSEERGISLNSARVLLDHVNHKNLTIETFFVDQHQRFYPTPTCQLYSNTPDDFDFKLKSITHELKLEQWIAALKACDLIFPVIHGKFGEDGQLQAILEQHAIPFVGNSSATCKAIYAKDQALKNLAANQFPTIASLVIDQQIAKTKTLISQFWNEKIKHKAIIKPCEGGSSIDVYAIKTLAELDKTISKLLKKHTKLLLQPYQTDPELTMVVLSDQDNNLTALPATETEKQDPNTEIFDYRSKYLATNATRHYTPARLNEKDTIRLQACAKSIFKKMNMRDFVRLDGYWNQEKGFLCNDINPYSGLEENSFLFKQATRCGMTHRSILRRIIHHACKRMHITEPRYPQVSQGAKKHIYVLMGGNNSEKQVSLISGRNIWLKLLNSDKYQPTPLFLDQNKTIWKLPYHLFLNHTCEEIQACISQHQADQSIDNIARELGCAPPETQLSSYPLEDFLANLANQGAYIFIALHGGFGENGKLQDLLAHYNIAHNGSCAKGSRLCIDKYQTQTHLQEHNIPGLKIQKQIILSANTLTSWDKNSAKKLWQQLSTQLDTNTLIIKPREDGCSTGIVALQTWQELFQYGDLIIRNATTIPPHTFRGQRSTVEMPTKSPSYLVEPFITTDTILVSQQQLTHKKESGWIELTIVIIEKDSKYHALSPSITVSADAVLSVEEKFQGGTGINLTPPPEQILSRQDIQTIQSVACQCAQALHIKQYARIDLFYHKDSQTTQVIEMNTLPALTPSTVLFQQALAEKEPIAPREFIEYLVESKKVYKEKSALTSN